tara:strand:- start:3767 stop:3928 length:162 start_codon:yes stop_codon:yes gene_type:complete
MTADVEKEYSDMGYVLTEIDGAIYVQKQEAIGSSQEIPVPTLRDPERDCGGGS